MDLKEVIENNLKDHLIVSDFEDESFKDIDLCLGIDEGLFCCIIIFDLKVIYCN